MTWQTYTSGFERTFPRGATIKPWQGGGVELSIPCSHNHEATEHYDKRLPMDKLRSHLINKGWTFRGKKASCPACNQKDDKPMERVTTINTPTPLKEQLQPVATNLARKARREAMQWLSEAFDPDKGKYSAGVSDATIAKETTLSEQAVAALRDEFFGSIKEPAEIAELRKAISDVAQQADALAGDTKRVVDNIAGTIRDLTNRLDALVKKNGW